MRNKKIVVYLCMGLLFTTVGCSNSNVDSDMSTADKIDFNDVTDTNAEGNKSNSQSNNEESTNNQPDNSVKNNDSQQDNNKDFVQQSDTNQSQADNAQLQSYSELDGSIESIGDNSVVISEIFHPSEDMAVISADSEKVLVTVYFSGETEFEVRTVKNGGVNGDADTEKRQGAFSDLEQGAVINMKGNYDGDDFHAKQVIIYNFV